jgi:carboxymethylenebutenolidase
MSRGIEPSLASAWKQQAPEQVGLAAMPTAAFNETIALPGGAEMGAYLALPASGTGPGVLVLMEIFGVGSYITRAADRLAALGYVALAPDLYRRLEPGLVHDHDQEGMQQALATVQKLDFEGAVEDSITALEALRERPEVASRPAGVLGFCLGGTIAFGVAAAADPDFAVCYYGSGVASALDRAHAIECPVLFHYGGEDTFISRADAERVAALADTRPGWECHIHEDGGHAFDNHDSDIFYRPTAASRAWELTRSFLERAAPTRS